MAQGSIGESLGMNVLLSAVHLGWPCMFVVFMESPILFTIFKFTPFSNFSHVGIRIVLYPLGDITFLLPPSTPTSTWPFFLHFLSCLFSYFELISSYMF